MTDEARVGRLSRWVERTHHLDRLELEVEWKRIEAASILDELSLMVSAGRAVQIEGLWNELSQPRMRRLFDFFFRPGIEEKRGRSPEALARDRVEPLLLLDTARGMVASALSVLASDECSNATTTEAGERVPWRSVAEDLSGAVSVRWWEKYIGAGTSGKEPIGITWFPPEAIGPPLSVRLPEVRDSGEGSLGSIYLLRLADGSGSLCPHPVRQSLAPHSDEFLRTIELAWSEALAQLSDTERSRALQFDYAWWITSDQPTQPGAVRTGGSHGAPLAVLILLALLERSADPDFTLTGALLPGGTIGRVDGVTEKARAAFRLRGAFGQPSIHRIFVPQDNVEEARAAAREAERDPEDAVHAVDRIVDIVEVASGLPAQLRRLAEMEVQEILRSASEHMRRPLSTWEEFVRLRVDMAVETDAPEGAGGWQGEAGFGPRIRLPWAEAFPRMSRCLLLGEPGAGKTSLLWHEAGGACQEFLRTDSDRTSLGVFTSAADLAEIQWQDEAAKCAHALAMFLISRRSVRPALRAATGTEIAQRVLDGTLVVCIDAIEELDGHALPRLLTGLRALLSQSHARLLISSRLSEYEVLSELVAQEEVAVLRPVEPSQARAMVRSWFSAEPGASDPLLASLNGELGELLETPQLVWMVCWLTSSGRHNGISGALQTRADILEAFLAESIEKWAALPPAPDPYQKHLLLPFASELALRLREAHGAAAEYDEAEVVAMAEEILPLFRGLRGRHVVQDLLSAGILSADRTVRFGRRLTFPSAVISEYLSSRALARAARAGGWESITDWVDDHAGAAAWHEVIIFLASGLPDPNPLLALLADAERDDEARTRLTLAANCLPDLARASVGTKQDFAALTPPRSSGSAT